MWWGLSSDDWVGTQQFPWLFFPGESHKFPVLGIKVKLSVIGANPGRRLWVQGGLRTLLVGGSTLTSSSCFLSSASHPPLSCLAFPGPDSF